MISGKYCAAILQEYLHECVWTWAGHDFTIAYENSQKGVQETTEFYRRTCRKFITLLPLNFKIFSANFCAGYFYSKFRPKPGQNSLETDRFFYRWLISIGRDITLYAAKYNIKHAGEVEWFHGVSCIRNKVKFWFKKICRRLGRRIDRTFNIEIS